MVSAALLLATAAAIGSASAWDWTPAPAHEGTPCGVEIEHDGMTLYVTGSGSDTAVLYLTDVFGIQLKQNKLLADSFARSGYLVVAPDMFNGTPAPADLDNPDFDLTEFIETHNPSVIDPMLDSTIAYIKSQLEIETVVATGYCFGGRHAFRVLSEGRGVSTAFSAHPSLWEQGEIEALTGPVSIAAAEFDDFMSPAQRLELENLLSASDQQFGVSLYGGTSHGFGVRANISDPAQKFGKEEAFFQAVRWFRSWA